MKHGAIILRPCIVKACIFCVSILTLQVSATRAQDGGERLPSPARNVITVPDLLEIARDADAQKVRLYTHEAEKWIGYIVTVDEESLCMLSSEYDNDTDSDSLRIFSLPDVMKVSHDASVGTFPLFTILVSAVITGICGGYYHWEGNAAIACPGVAILTLPIGGLIDGIFGALDDDKSWTWVYLQKDTQILREHALFPAGIPPQYAEAFKLLDRRPDNR